MANKTIESIPVTPFAMMLGAISGVIGFIVGLLSAIFWAGIVGLIPTTPDINLSGLGILGGALSIIVAPIVSFIVGLIVGFVIALVYNFLAPRIGGIQLTFKDDDMPPPP